MVWKHNQPTNRKLQRQWETQRQLQIQRPCKVYDMACDNTWNQRKFKTWIHDNHILTIKSNTSWNSATYWCKSGRCSGCCDFNGLLVVVLVAWVEVHCNQSPNPLLRWGHACVFFHPVCLASALRIGEIPISSEQRRWFLFTACIEVLRKAPSSPENHFTINAMLVYTQFLYVLIDEIPPLATLTTLPSIC